MGIWRINGGNRLEGSITVQGSKNSVLPIMAAAILSGCETELLNVPRLNDTDAAMDILKYLGCSVSALGDAVQIDSRPLLRSSVPHEFSSRLRASVVFMGALLARCGEARLAMPGGCALGKRPIDLHIDAIKALGASVEERDGEVICRAERGLRGAVIELGFPSVGATENAILAACGAKGTTTLINAAREPEIMELQHFLRLMGAKISGAGTGCIQIEGFEPVSRVGYRVLPDRIVAATMLCASAATGGDVEIRGIDPQGVASVTSEIALMGCEVRDTSLSVRIKAGRELLSPGTVLTKPYPGFPTDAQPLLMAASLRSRGTTVFVENIFESRFRHVPELRRLGADIITEGRVAVVTGVRTLRGAPVESADLRGGAALVIAGLSAEGRTEISDLGYIDRGYENLDGRLRELGGDIRRYG